MTGKLTYEDFGGSLEKRMRHNQTKNSMREGETVNTELLLRIKISDERV